MEIDLQINVDVDVDVDVDVVDMVAEVLEADKTPNIFLATLSH